MKKRIVCLEFSIKLWMKKQASKQYNVSFTATDKKENPCYKFLQSFMMCFNQSGQIRMK